MDDNKAYTNMKLETPLAPEELVEWQCIAHTCLNNHTAPVSALEAAYLALRADDPALAQNCLDETIKRKSPQPSNN